MTRALHNLKKISRLANATAGMFPRRDHSTACHNLKTIADALIEELETNPTTRPVSHRPSCAQRPPGTGHD